MNAVLNRPVVVVTQHTPEQIRSDLQGVAEVLALAHESKIPGNARALVCTVLDPVRADLLENFPASLGLIANYGVGTDNIDLPAAAAKNICVSNTPVVTEDTADLTLALMLAACRRLTDCESLLRNGEFMKGAGIQGQRVHGKILGIVGLGAIGQAVARRARGFDMQVRYWGPGRKLEAEADTGAVYCKDLLTLLQSSDILSLHCPLNSSTHHLLNADTMAHLKKGAVVINTGRGPLIEEAALVEALDRGQLGAVGLDVFEFEPEISSTLQAFHGVTLLPHIGSATGECRADMAARVVENVSRFLDRGRPLDTVTD